MPRHDFALLEGRWFHKKNQSIYPIFDTLMENEHNTANAYFRFQFPNAEGLAHIIRHVARTEATLLYLGAHGDRTGIEGSLGKGAGRVTREALRHTLAECWLQRKQHFDGLFFGSCSFGTMTNARFFLCGSGDHACGTTWFAGYSRQVDWMDSTLFDALVLKYTLALEPNRRKARATLAALFVKQHCLGLAKRLGFQIFLRDGDAAGGVRALLEY